MAQILREADAAYGHANPPQRKPTFYNELAEALVGQLDPGIVSIARHHAAERCLDLFLEMASGPNMSYAQKKDAMLRAMDHARTVHALVLEGRLAHDEVANARIAVQKEGA